MQTRLVRNTGHDIVASLLVTLCLHGCAASPQVQKETPQNDSSEICPLSALRQESQRKRVLDHTVMLRVAPAGAGAGILTKDQNNNLLIITLAHVVEGESEVEFLVRGEENWQVGQVSYLHDNEDFALINTSIAADNWKNSSPFICMLGELDRILLRDADLTHVGYSEGPWTESSSGGTYRSHDETWVTFTSEDFYPGQSGGPLVNEVWQIVGLGVGRSTGSENRALRIDRVMTLLNEVSPGATLYTTGMSSDEVVSRNNQARLSEQLSTLLNEYFFRAKDLIATMEAGRVTNSSTDPTFDVRVQAYNLAHDSIVNRRTQLKRKINSTFGEKIENEFDNVYTLIRGVDDDPSTWSVGEIGMHSALYQGLSKSTARHNSEGAKGMVPKDYYATQLNAARSMSQDLREAIDSFLNTIEEGAN